MEIFGVVVVVGCCWLLLVVGCCWLLVVVGGELLGSGREEAGDEAGEREREGEREGEEKSRLTKKKTRRNESDTLFATNIPFKKRQEHDKRTRQEHDKKKKKKTHPCGFIIMSGHIP